MDNVLAGADFPTKNATKFKAINTRKKLICANVKSTGAIVVPNALKAWVIFNRLDAECSGPKRKT